MDEKLEAVWARWCARRVVPSRWQDAPEVVLRWLDTGDEELREAAAWAAWAAREAAEAAWANGDDGEASERAAQQHARDLIFVLSESIPSLGLAVLRTDEAQEDPWLTREVWRALGAPDFAVACDWYAHHNEASP